MDNPALEANEWGIWLVDNTDQGTIYHTCVNWKTIAKYLKELSDEEMVDDNG